MVSQLKLLKLNMSSFNPTCKNLGCENVGVERKQGFCNFCYAKSRQYVDEVKLPPPTPRMLSLNDLYQPPQESKSSNQMVCEVCQEEKHVSVSHEFSCSHMVCLEDGFGWAQHCLLSENTLARCVNPECKLPLAETELEIFLEKYRVFQSGRLRGKTTSRQLITEMNETCSRMLDRQIALYLQMGLDDMGGIKCPGVDCKMVVADSNNNLPERVDCTSCNTQYCSKCRTSPFHPASSCAEVGPVKRAYTNWLHQDREALLQRLAQQDQRYQTQVNEYNNNRQRHEAEGKRVTQLRAEFEADERWKRDNLRLCPNCNRVVYKISGCNLMVCGRDYHEGNTQNGCGAGFRWNEAKAYSSDNADNRRFDNLMNSNRFTSLQPERVVEYFREDNGSYAECELCAERIQAVKLQCINCPYLVVCVRCETEAIRSTHASAVMHDAQHVFKLTLPP